MIEELINSVKGFFKPIEPNPNRRLFLKTAGLTTCAIMTPLSVYYLFDNIKRTNNYRPKYQTIAHEFLDLEKDFEVTDADYQILDDIIDEAKQKIEVKPMYSHNEAVTILKTIYSILKERGFEYEKNGLLNHGLKTKKIDCDNYSIIYLAIAETLNLPIFAVNAPEHIFIRWDPDGKHDAQHPSNPVNKSDFNFETTAGSIKNTCILTDDYYKFRFNIADKSIAAGVFLKNLNRNETLAIQYNNRGIAWEEKGNLDSAIEDYNQAIKFNPKSSAAYNNRGNAWNKKGNFDNAIEDYNQAIILNPKSSAAYNNRGIAWKEKGNFDNAIEDYNQAIILNPKSSAAYNNRGIAWKEKGNLEKANEDFSTAQELMD